VSSINIASIGYKVTHKKTYFYWVLYHHIFWRLSIGWIAY